MDQKVNHIQHTNPTQFDALGWFHGLLGCIELEFF